MSTLTVNPSAPTPARALCLDVNRPNTPAPFTTVAFGEKVDVDLYISDGSGGYDARSGLAGYSPRVVIQRPERGATSGTFTLGDGTVSTTALDYDATAQEVKEALNALNSGAGPYSDTVTVRKHGRGAYSIVFDTAGAQNLLTADLGDLQPESAARILEVVAGASGQREEQLLLIQAEPLLVSSNLRTITSGWRLTLNANNSDFYRAVIEAQGDLSADYGIELVDPGNRRDLLAAGPVICKQGVYDPAALTDMDYSDTPTTNSVVNDREDITGLTGGTASDLDNITTSDLSVGYTALLNVTIAATVPGKIWRLVSGTDAEDPAAGTVRPDDYAASTNEKVWKVQL